MRFITVKSRSRQQRGAVAIMVALSMVVLCLAAALVIDLGLLRVDRQQNKSAADAAVMSGTYDLVAENGNDFYPFRAVCTALTFLKVNDPDFASFAQEKWSDGNGDSTGMPADPCVDPTFLDKTCTANSPAPASWARFTGSTGEVIVRIQSGYELGSYREDNLPALTADVSEHAGCDQVSVIIAQSSNTTLGALSADKLSSSLRSVGRVDLGDGEVAPALLLLEQTKCAVLQVGSNNVGSLIWVKGKGNNPGSIHADSDGRGDSTDPGAGANCSLSTGSDIFTGKHSNGVVASGAPGNGDSGQITSVAGTSAVDSRIIYDHVNNVYATTANTNSGGGTPPSGREQVTRVDVDLRYAAGVRQAILTARPYWTLTRSQAETAAQPWKTIACGTSAADQSVIGSLVAADKLYVDCPGNPGLTLGSDTNPVVLNAGSIFVNGWISGGVLRLPNAKSVYISNPGNKKEAMSLTNNNGFCLRSSSCPAASPSLGCNTSPTASLTDRATLFVRSGTISSNGGILRLCNTTVFMLGGDNTLGCVPATDGSPPTVTPCPAGTEGTGQLSITASAVLDWTAPNATGSPADVTAWTQHHEDLALWAESYADNDASGGTPYKFTGSGLMETRGIFMVPNADPFTLGGDSNQVFDDAQYIVRRFATGGQGSLTMSVDANNAVTIPDPAFSLVR